MNSTATDSEARREFLSALLQEFRPSVSSLSTLSRALRRDGEELAPSERAGMLERMDGCAHHLDTVLREVAEVLVSESLNAAHRTERVDVYLPQLVGTAATMSGLALDRLTVNCQPDVSLVRTDSDKCLRILVKLLEEAMRNSSPDDGIEVHLSRRAPGPGCPRENEGPGCPRENEGPGRPRDDEMGEIRVLARGCPAASSLGLWIASRLAEAMGGGLECEARPDGGGAMRAWFPALPSTTADARPGRAQELTR